MCSSRYYLIRKHRSISRSFHTLFQKTMRVADDKTNKIRKFTDETMVIRCWRNWAKAEKCFAYSARVKRRTQRRGVKWAIAFSVRFFKIIWIQSSQNIRCNRWSCSCKRSELEKIIKFTFVVVTRIMVQT